MVRKTRRQAEWVGLVKEYESNDVDMVSFCRAHGLNVGTFKWWRGRLRKLGMMARAQRRVPSQPTLLPVKVLGGVSEGEREVRVRVGRAELAFAPGTDPEYIGRLAAALASTC